ncbi:MAG: hypothetical protein U1F41_15970 [Burkholderiales bacterium]
MIDCIFTIDYEIYGNGEGSLDSLVHGPTASLMQLFDRHAARFVAYVEVGEFEAISRALSDPGIARVESQIRTLDRDGFEIALHIHPQWYSGRYESGHWQLEEREYNLCTLPPHRIEEIVGRGISYLREVTGKPGFTPRSFRAGNWLFQPTRNVASVLARHGLRLDSSVFKGGLQRQHGLDYRGCSRYGYYWRFRDAVDIEDPAGPLLEIPIHTERVPFWKMLTRKRVSIQGRPASGGPSKRRRISRALDFVRPYYPRKLDFCRMTLDELTGTLASILAEDAADPGRYRPIVAIGHSKDLVDFDTIERFLQFLSAHGIRIATFEDAMARCVDATAHFQDT